LEEYLGFLMVAAAFVFLIRAHKRRAPATSWLYYCPVVFLFFSLVQYGNTIWGYQIAWFIIEICLAACILLLDRVILTWGALVGALALAVVGSYSSVQGLLIWPTGLILLYFRRRQSPYIIAWISVAFLTTLFYFRGYNFSKSPNSGFALRHPLEALKFFFFLVGDVIGKPVALETSTPDNSLVVLFGVAIVLLAVVTIVICGIRRDEGSGSPIGVALICYGLLFAVLVTQGRSYFGYGGASWSRYTTFDGLILIGIYLALLGRGATASASLDLTSGSPITRSQKVNGKYRRIALLSVWILTLAAITFQIVLGNINGLDGARSSYNYDVEAAKVLRDIDHEPNAALELTYPFYHASYIRQQARVLEEHKLSVFS